jgi:hypothetical protein
MGRSDTRAGDWKLAVRILRHNSIRLAHKSFISVVVML